MTRRVTGALLLLVFSILAVDAEARSFLKLPSEVSDFLHPEESNGGGDDDAAGTRWAVLIAGSNGYWNYRHQVNQSS